MRDTELIHYPGYNVNQRSLLVNGRTQMNGNLTINGNISVNSTNIALGFQAGNIINGTQSGLPNGTQTTAVGSYTGMNHTGTNNTFIGSIAGQSGTTTYFSRTGNNNTYIGYAAQADNSAWANSTAIGTGAIITASSQIKLGNGETVSIPGATTATGLITANGGLTMGGSNNITLGSGATAPTVGQLGYNISSPTFNTSTTFSSGIESLIATMSLPIGIWIVSTQIVVVAAQNLSANTFCLASITSGTLRNPGNFHIPIGREIVYGETSFVVTMESAGILSFFIMPNTSTRVSTGYAYAYRLA